MIYTLSYFKPGEYEKPLASHEWEFEDDFFPSWGVILMSYDVFNNNEGVRIIEYTLQEFDLEKGSVRMVSKGELKHYSDLKKETKSA